MVTFAQSHLTARNWRKTSQLFFWTWLLFTAI